MSGHDEGLARWYFQTNIVAHNVGTKKLNKLDNNKNFQFQKGNRDRKDISYLKIKKVHKQEGWIGLLKVKKVWKQEG